MNLERFKQLADAWGADLRRWPESERAAAQALLGRDADARALLNRAAEFDAVLDAHVVVPPGARLTQAVLAGAPAVARPRSSGKRTGWQFPRSWWWSGAGVAGVGLAGAAVGAVAVAMALALVPAPRSVRFDGTTWASTAFDSNSVADWSEE